jgi:hypothetical protein
MTIRSSIQKKRRNHRQNLLGAPPTACAAATLGLGSSTSGVATLETGPAADPLGAPSTASLGPLISLVMASL